jgi:hypothetical protein
MTALEQHRILMGDLVVALRERGLEEDAHGYEMLLGAIPEKVSDRNEYVYHFANLAAMIQDCRIVCRTHHFHDLEQLITRETNAARAYRAVH